MIAIYGVWKDIRFSKIMPVTVDKLVDCRKWNLGGELIFLFCSDKLYIIACDVFQFLDT